MTHRDPATARGASRNRIATASDRGASTLGERLLDWYHRHQRPLPWRTTRDPYAILVSEIMLQQTQVERVVPKYREFLQHYPTAAALAAAPRAEVIRRWAPLGYNRRAVRLHELARAMAAHGGELPRGVDELRQLEGIGDYTACAVACFAFDEQVPTIDTNVRRVLGRLLAGRFGTAGPKQRELAEVAREILPADRARDWNQALMDLGATICTARAPACQRCPVSDLCAARPMLEATAPPRGFRAAETKPEYRAAESFVGSSRYYRGRVVSRLRALEVGAAMAVDQLGREIRPDYRPEHRAWLVALVGGLARDGLVRLEPGDNQLGEATEQLQIGLP